MSAVLIIVGCTIFGAVVLLVICPFVAVASRLVEGEWPRLDKETVGALALFGAVIGCIGGVLAALSVPIP